MSQPRKQHYLPQFYLRGFSLDGRGLHQIEKANGKHYGCQVKDTAAVKDFHALDYEGVEDPHALERRLADMEGELARHLHALLASGIQNHQARMYTLQLLSVMRLRVPAFKEHIEASLPSSVRKLAELMERDGKFPKPPAGLEEKLKVKNLRITILNWKSMELIFKLAGSEDVLAILYGMRASMYAAPPGMAFVTSDQPVAMFHPTAAESPYGVGLDTPGVEITLPLSATKLLKLDHSQAEHEDRVASPKETHEFNRRTIAMASRYVFASSPAKEILDLCRETRGIRAGFVFDDLHHRGGLVQVHRFLALGPRNE